MSDAHRLATSHVVGRDLPSTRYRGSKRRFATPIAQALIDNRPSLLYDAMGGSGTVCALADRLGIPSHYNDLYCWTTTCARTLLVHRYTQRDLDKALASVDACVAEAEPGFISGTFRDCYFTDAENLELDGLIQCLEEAVPARLHDLIYYGVAQAALAKMPMSMFHRASIGQRLASVERRSGNSTTWATPFATLVPKFMEEAVLFTWRRRARHKVTRSDAAKNPRHLSDGQTLFLDPPYINPGGGVPSYAEAYHFLEGLAGGRKKWEKALDFNGRHPQFTGSAESSFETPEGWKDGVGTILDHVTDGSALATGRIRDSPGATKLRLLLKDRFSCVRGMLLHSTTIFTERKNAEYLFAAH